MGGDFHLGDGSWGGPSATAYSSFCPFYLAVFTLSGRVASLLAVEEAMMDGETDSWGIEES